MLIIAPPDAISYFETLIVDCDLPGHITLVAAHPASPDAFMALASQHHDRSGPFRRLFAILDLPMGNMASRHFYTEIRQRVRHHDIVGNVLFRVLFSRPDFSLWRFLHTPMPPFPSDPADYDPWLQQLARQSQPHPLPERAVALHTAMEQARFLARERSLRPEDDAMPFTEVHEMISYLLRMQQRLHYR
ncbi:MAG: hypothetical protein HQL83_06140 [Magnetococcales bacterium]|nr:hypothetical protein [Magnetococcales bacterium]